MAAEKCSVCGSVFFEDNRCVSCGAKGSKLEDLQAPDANLDDLVASSPQPEEPAPALAPAEPKKKLRARSPFAGPDAPALTSRSDEGSGMADDENKGGKGKGKEDGKEEKKEEKKETSKPVPPPKPTPVVQLAVTEPKPSGRCMDEYWQVQAVAEAAHVRKGGLQIFCDGKLVSYPNASGLKLVCEVFLPGKGGNLYTFTARHVPSGTESKPVEVKTKTVGYSKFSPIGWFHKVGDLLDKSGFFDKGGGENE